MSNDEFVFKLPSNPFFKNTNFRIFFHNPSSDPKDKRTFIESLENFDFKKDIEVHMPEYIKNNPRITKINFGVYGELPKFDSQPLKEALTGFELGFLEIQGKNQDSDGINTILDCFEHVKIEVLSLSSVHIDDRILKSIGTIKNIQNLKLNAGCKIERTEVPVIYPKSITFDFYEIERDFGNNTIFYDFISKCILLQELNVFNPKFSIDFKKLYSSLKEKKILNLHFESVWEFENFEDYLKVLSLPKNQLILDHHIRDKCICIPIFKHLSPNLVKICTWWSDISFEGFDEYMKKNQNIEMLELTKESFFIGVYIEKSLSNNHFLTKLNLKGYPSKIVLEFYKDKLQNDIVELNIIDSFIDDEDCSLLSSYLSKNPNLKSLNLSNNRITDEGFKEIAKAIYNHYSLKELTLSGNFIGNNSCFILKDILKSITNLECLKIDKCKFDLEGLLYIGEGLQYNTKLRFIDVNSNILFHSNITDFLKLLFFNTGVINLPLDNNEYKLKSEPIIQRNSGFIHVLKISKFHFLDLKILIDK